MHVHYVVQPVSRALVEELDTVGPGLQLAMFDRGEAMPREQVDAFAERARTAFARL